MKRLVAALVGLAVPFTFLVASSSGAVQTASGDACSAFGSGTNYTLDITVPGNAPPQAAFAFGAHGAAVNNVLVEGAPGTGSSTGLPAGSSAEVLLPATAQAGPVTADLTTTAPVSGSFRVWPATAPPTSFYGPVTCQILPSGPRPDNRFHAATSLRYVAGLGAWHELVYIPTAGQISAVQLMDSNQVMAPKTLVQSHGVVAKSGGIYALTLKLTGDGKKALGAHGSVSLQLSVSFIPTNGKAANRVIRLTMAR